MNHERLIWSRFRKRGLEKRLLEFFTRYVAETGETKRLRETNEVVRYILALVTDFFSLDSNSFQKSRLTIRTDSFMD